MSRAAELRERKRDALDDLRRWLPEGSTVHVVLRSVSSSGMSRRLVVLAVVDGQVRNVGWQVSHVLGLRLNESMGRDVTIRGGGMDIGFQHLLNCLSWALHGKGGALRHEWL